MGNQPVSLPKRPDGSDLELRVYLNRQNPTLNAVAELGETNTEASV
jgi:hypothetical protein